MFGFVSEASYDRVATQLRNLEYEYEDVKRAAERLERMVIELEEKAKSEQNVHMVIEEQKVQSNLKGIEMFAFDWNVGRAFSIERINGKTVIGYINAEGKNGEWHFSCDEDAHIELVKEFREFVKAKTV